MASRARVHDTRVLPARAIRPPEVAAQRAASKGDGPGSSTAAAETVGLLLRILISHDRVLPLDVAAKPIDIGIDAELVEAAAVEPETQIAEALRRNDQLGQSLLVDFDLVQRRETARRVDDEIRALVMRGYETARQIVERQRVAVKVLALELLDIESVDADRLKQIVAEHVVPISTMPAAVREALTEAALN